MDWLTVVSIAAYLAAIGVAGWCVVLLASGRYGRDLGFPSALLLAAGAAWGGAIVSAMVTPDWNPLTMLLAFIPFWWVAAWALIFARLVSRGLDERAATKRAALLAIPALLLTPIGGLVASTLGGILVILAVTLVLRRRSARQSTAATPLTGVSSGRQ